MWVLRCENELITFQFILMRNLDFICKQIETRAGTRNPLNSCVSRFFLTSVRLFYSVTSSINKNIFLWCLLSLERRIKTRNVSLVQRTPVIVRLSGLLINLVLKRSMYGSFNRLVLMFYIYDKIYKFAIVSQSSKATCFVSSCRLKLCICFVFKICCLLLKFLWYELRSFSSNYHGTCSQWFEISFTIYV